MTNLAWIAFLVYNLLWDAFCIGGTVYLIVCHGWSAWWMILGVLLCTSGVPSKRYKVTKDGEE